VGRKKKESIEKKHRGDDNDRATLKSEAKLKRAAYDHRRFLEAQAKRDANLKGDESKAKRDAGTNRTGYQKEYYQNNKRQIKINHDAERDERKAKQDERSGYQKEYYQNNKRQIKINRNAKRDDEAPPNPRQRPTMARKRMRPRLNETAKGSSRRLRTRRRQRRRDAERRKKKRNGLSTILPVRSGEAAFKKHFDIVKQASIITIDGLTGPRVFQDVTSLQYKYPKQSVVTIHKPTPGDMDIHNVDEDEVPEHDIPDEQPDSAENTDLPQPTSTKRKTRGFKTTTSATKSSR